MSSTRSSSAGGAEDQPVKRKYDLLDLHILDCPICCEALSPPVFQCTNGHTACPKCCAKLALGCPSCWALGCPSQPIGSIRCLAIEKVLECLRVSCKHGGLWARGGECKMTLKYSEIEAHENVCFFGPYRCPVADCGHETHMWKILVMRMHDGYNSAVLYPSTRSVKLGYGPPFR